MELYSVIGEIDNAGYPIAYCLLSTATAITLGKQTKALSAFLLHVKTVYKVNPSFCHVDKDFAEIAALGKTWPDAKIQLCWWHLHCAVMQRLAKPSLRTSEYDADAAHEEFHFIPTTFHPKSRPNPADNEGYCNCSDDEYNPTRRAKRPKKVTSTQPRPPIPTISSQCNPNALTVKLMVPISFTQSRTQPLPAVASVDSSAESTSDDDETQAHGIRQDFCPTELREAVVSLLEQHYCAHPMIPAFARPEPVAIQYWAVKQMFKFCQQYKLPELWAYLWQNWYSPARWKLWARSTCMEISRLKTTMICESQ